MPLLTHQVDGPVEVKAVRTKEPVVVAYFGSSWASVQLSPDDARQFAADLIAAAAELDGAEVVR